ncbi:MAG: translation initiation factor IF-2 [Clostridia bacterium]|nr:translation initiation factor IF-2 [Clostridia bacterium]
MAKKVSDIMTELDISYQELKRNSDKLGIKVTGEEDSMEDRDAGRIISTINMLKGNDRPEAQFKKPKIKATPIISKPAPMAKREKEEAPKEEPKKRVGLKIVKTAAEVESEEAAAKAEKKAAKEKEAAEKKAAKKFEKKSEKKTSDKPAEKKASDHKAEEKKPAKKAEEKKEEYTNAPNKPMRFKKIFDASKAPQPEAKESGKSSDGRKKRNDRNDRRGKDGQGRRDGGNRRNNNEGRNDHSSRRSTGASAPEMAAVETGKGGKGKSKKFFDHNKDKNEDRSRGDCHNKHGRHEGNGGGKNSRYFDENSLEKQTRHKKKKAPKNVEPEVDIEELLPEGTIAVTVPITVAGLAEQAEISPTSIIMSLMKMGIMATLNQTIDKDVVEMLAEDLGISVVVTEEVEEEPEEGLDLHEDAESELKPRAPIITVMGHVDHGKTSLLDAIRNTNVTAGESGGITQHIGASEVTINGKKIVFLDTPGHEAFTTMRARGAQITDIAVLVVAADDSVKPQTIESISHAKAANVPIIVAINKMDKPGANPDKVKKDLADNGILVEDWGGDVISVPVSAKKGEGITDLLEMILLEAEMLELKANPDRLALGTVIEARLDKARGPIATLLVMNGTLKTGQSVVAGTCSGKIRVMTNFKGDKIRKAGPATAVEILGLSDVPMAGDAFNAVKDDKVAREIANSRAEKMREDVLAKNASMTLDKLFSQIQEGETKELNLIIKADVQGSVGAIISSLEKLDTPDVRINVVHSGVGTVTESDVMLAETSNAIIIGFNVRPTTAVTNQAADADVEIRTYRVIYDIIDEISDAMKGMLDPEFREEILGKAEIRDTFRVPNVGTVGGAYVTEGKIQRNAQIRLVRDGIVIHEGTISSLKRYKDDAKEVATGYECGLGIENYNDIKPGDTLECFTMVEVER